MEKPYVPQPPALPDPTERTGDAIEKAIDLLTQFVQGKVEVVQTKQAASELSADLRLAAHHREHELIATALKTALEAVVRENLIHAESHTREHALQAEALAKAERAADIRFAGVNEFREQLRDQATRLASAERVDLLAQDLQRRLEEQRTAITALEKAGVKDEGRSAGQGWVIAAIVGVVSFIATVLGVTVVILNLATQAQ